MARFVARNDFEAQIQSMVFGSHLQAFGFGVRPQKDLQGSLVGEFGASARRFFDLPDKFRIAPQAFPCERDKGQRIGRIWARGQHPRRCP